MQHLKANTQTIVTIGPFVDVSDGFTPETGITLGAADEAELIKHGSTSVVDISAATWAAVTGMDGYYSLTLTTSHTDTEGQITVAINDDSVCLPVIARFNVLAEAAYDSMYAAKDTGYMDVNVKAVSEDTTAADNLESACDNYSATRGLSGTALPNAAADAAGGLPISDAGALDLDTILARITANVATATALATAQTDLDTLTGTDGVTLATAQGNYAPALASALATAQADLDLLTGTDGATLATSQPNYAPAIAGSEMNLADGALTAAKTDAGYIAAVQLGLGTQTKQDALQTSVDDIPTVAEFNARTLLAAAYFDPAVDVVANVTLTDTVTTYTGNTKQTADHTAGIAAIKAITDAIGATAAANLAKTLGSSGIISGTAQTGTLSTTQMSTDLTEATDDHYIGRVIIWTSGDLAGQAAAITDYTGTGGILTFAAVTDLPVNGQTFIIV